MNWLETLLKERFHTALFIQRQPDESLHLAFPGQTNTITLASLNPLFFQTEQQIPCIYWDSSLEGWHTVLGKQLPAPGIKKLPSPVIAKAGEKHTINYDILGLCYWMLSRQEEVNHQAHDEHGRFPASASHAYRNGYLERPIVDEWLDILKQVIQRTWRRIKLKQHNFQISLSHDVDRPFQYRFTPASHILRQVTGDFLKRKNIKLGMHRLLTWQMVRRENLVQDPYNTFDWLMDISEKNNLSSAFYFICGRTDDTRDADYEPEHPIIRQLMRRIHQRGHEIGLHPSYNTYQKPMLIQQEAERLKRICKEEGIQQPQWGGRMHYLRWEQPTTLDAWANSGMHYDATLGYADHPGFRCGTCHEYQAFNPVAQQAYPLRIRPLIVMECTLIASAYLGLGLTPAATERIHQLWHNCYQVAGKFTMLWHNSELYNLERQLFYENILSQNTLNYKDHGSY